MTGERFIVTKEHRRFTEFADSVRHQHTIGLCFGPAGVGKTLSAKRYAHWDAASHLIKTWGPRSDADHKIYAALNKSRCVFYTPSVLVTPRILRDEIEEAFSRVNICIQQHLASVDKLPHQYDPPLVELIIVDESERLSAVSLELLRDRYDQDNVALILIAATTRIRAAGTLKR